MRSWQDRLAAKCTVSGVASRPKAIPLIFRSGSPIWMPTLSHGSASWKGNSRSAISTMWDSRGEFTRSSSISQKDHGEPEGAPRDEDQVGSKSGSAVSCRFSCEWWAHLDSNQGPTGYEPGALPAELWARMVLNLSILMARIYPVKNSPSATLREPEKSRWPENEGGKGWLVNPWNDACP
jgi:hypothetical protein